MQKLLLMVLVFIILSAKAQVKIGDNPSSVNPNSLFEMESNSKGMLLPRLTSAQIIAMNNPPKGMIVFNVTDSSLYLRRDSGWTVIPVSSNANSKTLYWANASDGNIYNTNNGNIGVGTNTPAARLHVADSSVVFTASNAAPGTQGNPPVSGPGRRMMWFADKAAFRVGYVSNTNWDKDSIGNYSFASGYNTKARGTYSVALGNSSIATGVSSMALGNNSLASGNSSIAMGEIARAIAQGSTALGGSTTANGLYSTAMGIGTNANGLFSTAIGAGTNANGFTSTAMGNGSTAGGLYTTAMGNGTNTNGMASTAMGNNTVASSDHSTSMGNATNASGQASTAMGNNTIASGGHSTAMGNASKASGQASTAMGSYNIAKGYASTVIGEYNDSILIADETSGTISTTPLFIIGNGNETTRSNAFLVRKDGNVGVGTNAPAARLHIADSSAVFAAADDIPGVAGNVPVSGVGRRMMWYADKAAFRVGYVNGSNWNKDSIGDYSFASGYNTKAKGMYSFASGLNTTASGISSIALGNSATASANYSTAFGANTTASGIFSIATGITTTAGGLASIAMGNYSTASAMYSTALGSNTTASGIASTALGSYTTASAGYTTAMGAFTKASGQGSTATGFFNVAKGYASTVIGEYSDSILTSDEIFSSVPTTPLFIIGNGSETTRRNALVVRKDGKVGIGTSAPLARLHIADSSIVFTASGSAAFSPGNAPVSGAGRRMMWYADKAAFRVGYVDNDDWDKNNIGNYSFASGFSVKALGSSSVAIGSGANATGNISVAMGNNTIASGDYSIAMGSNTAATGFLGTAMGSYTTAGGVASTALGLRSIAKGYASMVIGTYNDSLLTSNETSLNSTTPLFIVGNGNDALTRSNALVVRKNGNMEVNGKVRQQHYSQAVTVPANGSHTFTWNHNLGYQPVIMLSLDQTGGGYLDYVNFSYAHNNNNSLTVYLTNRAPANAATGTVRWIVVY